MFESKARGFPVNRYHFCLLDRDPEQAPESPSVVRKGNQPLTEHGPGWVPFPGCWEAAKAAPARFLCPPGHPGGPAWSPELGGSQRQGSSQPRVRQLAGGAERALPAWESWCTLKTSVFSLQFGLESKLGLESSGLVQLLRLHRCTTFVEPTLRQPEKKNQHLNNSIDRDGWRVFLFQQRPA